MMFDKDGKLKDDLIKKMVENQKLAAERKDSLTSMLVDRNAPAGSKCPRCDKETLKVKSMPFSGAYSGSIYCSSCDFRDSVIGYLGKQMIQVEPMPQGAQVIYCDDSKDNK